MDELAVCAVVRNEGHYIYEWLSFHRFVGVERFYLYDNNSTDDTIAEIDRWPDRHLVTLTKWPDVPGQFSAYHHMLTRYRDAALWCAFIDCDEFLCPRTDVPVRDFLCQAWPLCDALNVHWLMFGSSGHLAHQAGLVTERFVRRGHTGFGPNVIGKTIVKLSRAAEIRGPHVILPQGRFINEMNIELDEGGQSPLLQPSHRFLAVNHYFTKSLEEWRRRRALGKADRRPGDADFMRTDEEFHRHDVNNVEDRVAAAIMAGARGRYY